MNFCASRKPAVTESENRGLKARFLPSDVRSDGCDGSTTGWLSPIQARTVSKTGHLWLLSLSRHRKGALRWERSWQGQSPEGIQAGQPSQLDGRLGSWAGGKPLTQSSRSMSLHVLCTTPSSSFWGLGGVLLLRYFPPKKEDMKRRRDEATEVGPPSGVERVRVGKDFLPRTAPSRSGRVLQTLVGAQESFAVGTVMVHVLQGVHAERDEAAAGDAPGGQTQPTRSRLATGAVGLVEAKKVRQALTQWFSTSWPWFSGSVHGQESGGRLYLFWGEN